LLVGRVRRRGISSIVEDRVDNRNNLSRRSWRSGRNKLAWAVWAAVGTAAVGAGTARAGSTNIAPESAGSRISVRADDPKAVNIQRQTPPESVADGNPHTRQVVTGAPYTIRIQLRQSVPIEKLAFQQSDYKAEVAPKDIEIRIDGGAPIPFTLEPTRPARNAPAWQEVPVGKQGQVVEVTVKSNHPGEVNWGGIGEIAVYSSVDTTPSREIANFDPKAPTFVNVPPFDGGATPKVTMPPLAQKGEHPRLFLTPGEAKELREALNNNERGKGVLKSLVDRANAECAVEPEFPDPKGPMGQLKDRGDAVARAHDALSYRAGNLGIAYTLTGDKRYAEAVAKILRGYAERYEQYPEHKGANAQDTGKVYAQRLSEAMWLIPLIASYDHIHDSGVLTEADHTKIRDDLIRACLNFIWRSTPDKMAADLDRREPGWRTKLPERPAKRKQAPNWLLFYNAATMMAGSTMDDQDMMDLAAFNVRNLVINGIGDDGMWNEGAVGYQFFAMQALVANMEPAARRGIDLWGYSNAIVKRLFDSPGLYAYPDGSMPGINDSARNTATGWQTMIYDYAYLRYGDERYAGVINASPRQVHISSGVYVPTRIYQTLPAAPSVNYPSTVFADLGYAVLRDDKQYALIDYGPHGGVHGHLDKLNLILFGNGDELGGEPVFNRYEDPRHGEWTKQTVAHNTMTVDERSQSATTGKLLAYQDSPTLKVMRAEASEAYPGVLMDRTVVAVPGAWVDVYTARGNLEHTYDRTLRFGGELVGLSPSATPAPLGTEDGYQHLMVAARNPASDGWLGQWKTPKGVLSVVAAGVPGQEVVLGTGPNQDQLALVRQKGAAAGFATAYVLGDAKDTKVTLDALQPGQPRRAVATLGDGRTVEVYVADKQGAWKAGGVESDALVLAVVKKAGRVEQALLTGGTYAKADGVDLKLAAPGNAVAEAGQGGLAIKSQWAPTSK
jgi:hypothetical protein